MPFHEPLRQALGLLVAETSRRAGEEDADEILTRSCVKEVVIATRKRLLYAKFHLDALAHGGLALHLSKLEAWKSRIKKLSKEPRHVEVALEKPTLSGEKEATSLELHESLSGGKEVGDDEVSSALQA